MGRPSRITFKQFGLNVNAAADICEFGTPATGSPNYTNVVATLMASTAWLTGWAAETVANNRPFLEDMNCVDFVFSYFLNYILTLGIAEYDSGTTYFQYSFCQSGGLVYQCINDNSGAGISGIATSNGTYWVLFPAGLGAIVSKSFNTIYLAASDGFVTGICQGVGASTETQILIGASSPPSTAISEFEYTGLAGSMQITLSNFVAKGQYYEVIYSTNSGSVLFQTLGE